MQNETFDIDDEFKTKDSHWELEFNELYVDNNDEEFTSDITLKAIRNFIAKTIEEERKEAKQEVLKTLYDSMRRWHIYHIDKELILSDVLVDMNIYAKKNELTINKVK